MTEAWIPTREAAELLGVSRQRVGVLIRKKQLKAKMFGRVWMVSRASCEKRADAKWYGETRY